MTRNGTIKKGVGVQRTRHLLSNALVALTVERGYEAITVQDILDRAGVSRSTFYSHFAGKDELLRTTIEGLRAGLTVHRKSALAAEDKAPGELGFVLPFLQHLHTSPQLYRAMLRGDCGPIVDRQVRRVIADLAAADLSCRAGYRRGDKKLEATVQFLVGALMSLISWWMDGNTGLTPEEINRIFLERALPGLETKRTGSTGSSGRG